ncbi:MAG: chaperonin GroEL [Proteobacteria bacterium]|nr:MAG: chaperonin GroEL [Pseudomonadota bacterium]
MPKMMVFDQDARAALGRGVNLLTRAVQSTLGPKGGNAIIDVPIGTPIVSRDGVSIAAEIELEDRYENMGAQVVREVSKRTNEVAGDGTTTATVLANALIQEGFKSLDGDLSAVDLVEGMNLAVVRAIESLKQTATPISDITGAAAAVAIIAANDETTGLLVADALDKVGPTGIVTVDIGLTVETTMDVIEGASYERGYVSHHMVNDVETMQIHLEDALLLLTDHALSSADDVEGLRALADEAGKPLLVIADDYSAEAVAALLDDHTGPDIVAVHPPEYGKWRQAMMEDIAIMTGGRVFVKALGTHFHDATIADLGTTKRIKISADTTVISGGGGNTEQIKGRVEQICRQLALNEVPIEEDKFNERLAKLSGGIAVIHAGGATPVEQKRRVLLIEDALNATRAALAEGVVSGGGTALIRTLPIIDQLIADLSGGIREGAEVVKRSLTRPLECIAQNSGVDPANVVTKVMAAEIGVGYDVQSGEYVDMIGAGIMDPVKVTYTALLNAVSVAALILTAQTLIADIPETDDPTAGPARGGGAEKYGMR